ncbi:MAG: UDP-N-acetylmuramoyl-tripeptide--D-alanyl-D-alanine ligase [Deltaproteobacteria bacterium]|nr:UDP-N-acetylmuramoyl-tripeptide--D-alanyl-D-alanine ligase [Deltaproteobacteria bacterium]
MQFSLAEILKITQAQILSGEGSPNLTSLSTDSRTVQKGDYFLCLVGEKFNAHDYMEEVAGKGAAALILEKKYFKPAQHQNLPLLLIGVEDTLKALGDLAQAWRARFSIPVLGIGGSNGKTTTKDMCAAILSEYYSTLATEGNLNNLIGVPKMIAKLDARHQAAIFELGMNDFGELARLTEIAQPTLGLLTNIGFEHLEKLKSLEGVAQAEAELFETLPSGSLALVNEDDPYISKMKTKAYRLTFGLENPADIFCSAWEMEAQKIIFEVCYLGKKYSFYCEALGEANLRNALAAVAVGFALALPYEAIKRGLQKFKARAMRMELISLGKKTLLNDCYNANPSSMEVALQSLAGLKKGKKALAILGEMRELGHFAAEGHRRVGKIVVKNQIDYLVSIGPYAQEMLQAAVASGLEASHALAASNLEEAEQKIKEWAQEASFIIVKGSRGAKMERVTELLKKSPL